jgi:septal ring factor EnvC (AmiA/AmiB activator)
MQVEHRPRAGKPRDILMFRSDVTRTARSLDETITQSQQQIRELQNQIRAERAQNAEHEKRIMTLRREVSEARLEILRRDRDDAFAAAPSPSAAVH